MMGWRKRMAWVGLGFLLVVLTLVLAPSRPALGGQIPGNKWTSIGPEPDCCFFPYGETGRVTSIAVNPQNPDDVWIGTAGGGVWHLLGGKWFPMSDDQASLAIGSLALAGCNSTGCAKIYVGTGENAIRRDTYYGAGLLEGNISGNSVSWTLHKGQAGPPAFDFTHGTIYNVVLDPTTGGASQVIYITVSSGVTASASESTVTTPPPLGGWGIYKSSDDGNTWTRLTVPGATMGLLQVRPTDLEMDRTNASTLYAGFLGRGIFKSLDGGANWCPLNPGIPKPAGCPMTYGLPTLPTQFDHVEVDIYRGDHNHLYASFGNCPDRLIADCEPSIYESTNAGLNWTARYIGSTTATSFGDLYCPRAYTRYMHGLTVSPTNPATVYVTGYHLCESDDHGETWFSIDDNSGGGTLHPDHHAIVFHETTTSRAYDVNDGGVAFSTDGGGIWTPSVYGLDTFEFQSLATSPSTTQVFGGTQDNSAVAWNGVKKWQHMNCCGDGGYAAYETFNFGGFFDKTDMYTTTNMNSLSNLAVLPVRSENGGGLWPQPGDPPVSYDLGLNDTDSRSFYPPLVVAGGYTMFATDRLYTSVDQMHDFQLRSPQLSSDPESEIFSHADAITAIAVAPSNPSRWYLGYYSGKIFYTDAACSTLSCWTQVSNPSGSAPVTWLAVDLASPDTVYATVSGFAPGIHVFKTTNHGVTWGATGSTPELSGVPANTITIDPGADNVLYLGTDHGIYRSENSGGIWTRFSSGLPNVPVYAITPDESRLLLFAATHGRGAWLLASNTGIGRTLVDGPIRVGPEIRYNLPVFGQKYAPNASCLVKVLAADGSVCASGRTDSIGGTIHTDAEGNLATSQANLYVDLPVVWACAHGFCLDTEMKKCIQGTQGPSGVEVACGAGVTVSKDPGPVGTPNPPSSRFTVDACTPPDPCTPGGTFSILPAIQTGDGASQIFCAPMVPFAPGDTQGMILQRTADMVNGDGSCRAAGVQAVVEAPQDGGEVEDAFAHSGHLSLMAPDLTGGKLIPGLRITPGQATGTCFTASDLADLMGGRIHSMKIEHETGPGGAAGGSIRILEQSLLGECDITVPTPAGTTASGIAAAVAAAFQAGGIPSPYPLCPVENNPRDLFAAGDSVFTALATDLTICVNDPGVGVTVLPAEICTTNADCDDGNPCTTDTCNPTTGLCQSTPAPDGTQCDDLNACTVGNVCHSGACGTPVVCNDSNPCTTDVCNPATGACTSTPLACDDGNPCTTDTCSAATGGCVFTPAPAGSTCNDGDPCTTGDSCVQIPGNPNPICQGAPKCADADPCTADTCDPATGACLNTPVVCDDANPCTTDACVGGTCVSTPTMGAVCDDGNLCTTGGSCQPDPFTGAPTCTSQPVNCDDGDACTGDSCDPTTGGCVHLTLAQTEVPNGFHFTTASSMTWPTAPGASFYNTYRGTIPQHMMASRPPAGPLYDQTCFEFGDAHGDGATISTDASSPPVGTGFYYLVSEETGCGESSIGSDWNGTPIQNANPCSNPAPPALQIVKSHSGNFTQGQAGATYFLVVSNIGPGPTFGTVTVDDTVPTGLTLVSMAGPGWTCPASPGNTCTRSDTLGPGAAYPPITVTVNVAANATSPQVNAATVSGGGAPTASSSDSTTIVQLAPALSITKTHSGNFHRGQTGATYSVTVTNTGNAPTSGTVTVADTVPVGFTNVSLSGTGWTCPAPGSTCTRSDALAPGGSYPVITVTLDVAPDAPLPTLTNQVTASGGGSASASASDPTQIDYPLLAMLKSHTGNFVQGQQGAVYTLSVQNQGFGPTAGTTVTVTENAPSGLTLVSMAGTGWSCPASPGNVCTRSDVLASTAFWPDITVTVNVATNAPSSVINVATISGGGSNGTGSANDITQIDTARIVLGITKTHSGNFVQGQPIATYTVSVHNGGNAPTSGTVTVTENAPAGLTLTSMAGTGWTCPSPGNTCTRSDALAPGANYPDITVTVSVAPNAPSSVTNQATVTGGGDGTLHTASDPTTINPGPPVLSVTKTHNGNFSQGQTNANYFVTITNVASQATIGPVMMMEQPPPPLAVVSMSGTGWTCDTVQCSRTDPLPGGASYPVITITVSVAAGTTSPQVNQVQVNGGGAPPVMATDSTTIIPAGVPNLSITKTHTGNFTQGQTNATYVLSVLNAVGAGATAGVVTVTETPPSGLTFVSMSGLGWSCAGMTCTRSTSIPPGGSAQPIGVHVNVLPTASSPQINQANVSGGGSAPSSTTDPTVILPP